MKNRYKGNIYDGRWKVLGTKDRKYVLENIYNHQQISIHHETMKKIDKGETTISKVMCYRLYQNGRNPKQPFPATPKVIYQIRHVKKEYAKEKGEKHDV